MTNFKCNSGNYSVLGVPSDTEECVANIPTPLHNTTLSCIRGEEVALRQC